MVLAERSVLNNELVSPARPRLRIAVDAALPYVGTVSLSLGSADAQLFAFASRSGERLERLLYVQFEAVRPTQEWTYNYQIAETIQLGAHSYMHDVLCRNLPETIRQRPQSDIAGIYNFLSAHGYTTPNIAVRHRFVRLLDEARRSEILLIYTENLGIIGLSCDEIAQPDGVAFLEEFKDRSIRSFRIIDD